MLKNKYFVEVEVLDREMLEPLQISKAEYAKRLAILRNPSKAIRDTSIVIQVGDIVHCRRKVDSLYSYLKIVLSYNPITGEYTVGTKYIDTTKDFMFIPEVIHGVITEIYDGDGNLVYDRENRTKGEQNDNTHQ